MSPCTQLVLMKQLYPAQIETELRHRFSKTQEYKIFDLVFKKHCTSTADNGNADDTQVMQMFVCTSISQVFVDKIHSRKTEWTIY